MWQKMIRMKTSLMTLIIVCEEIEEEHHYFESEENLFIINTIMTSKIRNACLSLNVGGNVSANRRYLLPYLASPIRTNLPHVRINYKYFKKTK